MQELTITILENKKMTYPSNIVLVEGENLTTQVTVSAPSWEGLSIGCLITTPAGVMVDEFSADAPFLLTNTMLDRRGYIRFEFVGYKITEDSKEEVTRTSHAVELPVRSARPRLGEISPEPLPDLIMQVTNAKNTALTAALQADEAAASAAEIDAQARAAEAARVAAENSRNVFAPYNAATAYVVGNKVTYLGSSYLCILASTGNLPTNGTYWMLIASKGDKGNTGDAGEMTIGTVTTLAPGEPATVTNTGTTTDAVLDIAIPAGYDGSAVPIDDASSAVDRVLSASYIKGKLSAIEDAFIEEGSAWA